MSVLKKYVVLCMAYVLLPVFAEASVGFLIYLYIWKLLSILGAKEFLL